MQPPPEAMPQRNMNGSVTWFWSDDEGYLCHVMIFNDIGEDDDE